MYIWNYYKILYKIKLYEMATIHNKNNFICVEYQVLSHAVVGGQDCLLLSVPFVPCFRPKLNHYLV